MNKLKNKGGRPQIQIKQEDFEKLCSMFCTLDEIAGFFKCSVDTIENWCKKTYGQRFSDIYKNFSADGKISLRRQQMKVALKGNVGMLIFLGKQYLGQKDNPENEEIEQTIDKLNALLGNIKSNI